MKTLGRERKIQHDSVDLMYAEEECTLRTIASNDGSGGNKNDQIGR